MSKFKKKRGAASPAISTASLPDIIFMLLFFFMVVTVLRDSELKLQVITPQATELTKLEKKSLVHYVYIGRPLKKYQEIYGTAPQIQLGDKFAQTWEIPAFVEEHRARVRESEIPAIITSMRVDGDITMGIVTDVKTQLRKARQYKVNYSAKQRSGKLQ
ncbi:MAG: biopolymer transporter ExbD [Saprospiraceae bacterium]|nr:biopolymer transporter ExbD [Saprospiraceae bacterium]